MLHSSRRPPCESPWPSGRRAMVGILRQNYRARRAPCRTQVISCGNLILCVCQSDFQKVLNRPPRQNSLSPIIRFTKPDNRTQNPIIRLVETGCKQIRENNNSALDKSSASPLRIGRLLSYCPPCRCPRFVLFSVNRFFFPYFVNRTYPLPFTPSSASVFHPSQNHFWTSLYCKYTAALGNAVLREVWSVKSTEKEKESDKIHFFSLPIIYKPKSGSPSVRIS